MTTQFLSKFGTILTATVLLISGASVAAHAQISQQIRVNVPFAFEQGGKHFSPGSYRMYVQSGNILTISGDRDSGFSLVNVGDGPQQSDTGKLIFAVYGKRYFLHQVWMPGQTAHAECLRSRDEKNLQKELRLASVANKPAGIEVAVVEAPR